MKEEKILLIIILSFLFLIGISYAQDKALFLEIVYFPASENIKFSGMYVNYGSEFIPPVVEGKTKYTIEIQDQNLHRLYSKDFSLNFVVLDTPMPDNITTIFILPYYPNAKKLLISKSEEGILTINLQLLCNNNGVCENYENYFSCENDCPSGSKDGACDKVKDGICDPDCAMPSDDPDCVKTTIAKITTTTIQPCNKNKKCEPQLGENYITCPEDCPSSSKPSMLWVYIIAGIVIIVLLVLFLTRISGGRKIESGKQIPY